jgi:hypothetical protein
MRYMMIVSFPMPSMKTFRAKTDAVIDVVGKAAFSGAGSGFGGRDVEFDFATMKEVDAAKARVAESFPRYQVHVMDREED